MSKLSVLSAQLCLLLWCRRRTLSSNIRLQYPASTWSQDGLGTSGMLSIIHIYFWFGSSATTLSFSHDRLTLNDLLSVISFLCSCYWLIVTSGSRGIMLWKCILESVFCDVDFWTYDLQKLISSWPDCRKHLCKVWLKSVDWFRSCRVHKISLSHH